MSAQIPVAAPPIDWAAARAVAYAAGAAAARAPVEVSLADADGQTLAAPLASRTDLPAFPTSSVDGWAVRGHGPWRIVGRVLAGSVAPPLTADGTCAEIATGAMVPAGTATIVRAEDSTVEGIVVRGAPRAPREWREAGEEAIAGESLLPAGTPVTPGVIGLAAACGLDTLKVRTAPRTATLVFGDELLTRGAPGDGRIRDSLGPQLPAWLRRLDAEALVPIGPVADTLEAHIAAVGAALGHGADVACTTGGTMRGPVDHLHQALSALGADYLVNAVAVRPGFPMLLAALPDGRFVAGLPGNPQSAIVALVSLVAPLLAGLQGRAAPVERPVVLGADVPGRGDFTHLALVTVDADGLARGLSHSGSSMLRGLAQAAGFVVIAPGTDGRAGARVPFVPLPVLARNPT